MNGTVHAGQLELHSLVNYEAGICETLSTPCVCESHRRCCCLVWHSHQHLFSISSCGWPFFGNAWGTPFTVGMLERLWCLWASAWPKQLFKCRKMQFTFPRMHTQKRKQNLLSKLAFRIVSAGPLLIKASFHMTSSFHLDAHMWVHAWMGNAAEAKF